MKRVDLVSRGYPEKTGQSCPEIPPNIVEDSLFYIEGELVGFFLRQMPDNLCQLANLADFELRSSRVPKTYMSRGPKALVEAKGGLHVEQYSTILGAVPPKPHMRRLVPNISSVHRRKSAQDFVKAMLLLADGAAEVIKNVAPNIYDAQKKLLADVPDIWKFGPLWTSSISNYNISAPYHTDNANIVGAVNVIVTKRRHAKGGNLHVPEYGATMDSCDNSMLVYPAWKNMHGVTPITPTRGGGYRNSLIFYPLKAFVGLD